ncbi:hypothetical protein ACCO45_004707 [Purpureocillium lilacinum]|uniref:Uncharacterized protein n=1 Tax=Purpureocillium lilacinum TaxID=33203 RepID=A0ACC4DTA6_PURLI
MALNITAFMINELRAIIYDIIVKHFIGQFIFRYRSRDYARRWNLLHCWTIIGEYEAHGRRKADWQVALLRGRWPAGHPSRVEVLEDGIHPNQHPYSTR